ncbi:MAG: class I SAM-dependent methyltransferase [Oscillospiraceae bacterium]
MESAMKNAGRFDGFAAIYDGARPAMPAFPAELVTQYLGRMPAEVVDLGSGTGLSALAWAGRCGRVTGIEPSADMLAAAREKEAAGIRFLRGYSHETGLPDAFADAVICSQSFHWMEPAATLAEVGRILKSGGVFAAVDCDWPPAAVWEAEQAYGALFGAVNTLEQTYPALRDSFCRWDKAKHLDNLRASGQFRFCREIVFHNTELCTAERFIGLAMSQGGLQSVLKFDAALICGALAQFSETVRRVFIGEREIVFSYRMRVGVK